jgi:hypothetical protein
VADAVEGEIASGMTRAIFHVDPHHLLAAAEMLVATGAATVTIASAPRWNAIAMIAETDLIAATFTIAGEDCNLNATQSPPEDDSMTFTFSDGRPSGQRKRSRAKPKPEGFTPEFLKNLPF